MQLAVTQVSANKIFVSVVRIFFFNFHSRFCELYFWNPHERSFMCAKVDAWQNHMHQHQPSANNKLIIIIENTKHMAVRINNRMIALWARDALWTPTTVTFSFRVNEAKFSFRTNQRIVSCGKLILILLSSLWFFSTTFHFFSLCQCTFLGTTQKHVPMCSASSLLPLFLLIFIFHNRVAGRVANLLSYKRRMQIENCSIHYVKAFAFGSKQKCREWNFVISCE